MPILRWPGRLLAAAWLAAALLLSGGAALAAPATDDGLQPIPALAARVTDTTGTLDTAARQALETRLATLERDKGAQIAVLLVATTAPEAIEQYAIRVAEAWKLGRKGVDDGVLLLVATQDRRLRIEVGYGLEGALNDATAKRIIADAITPKFRAGRIAEGIAEGAEQIARVVAGEPLPEPAPRTGRFDFDWETAIVAGFVILSVVVPLMQAIFGRFFGSVVVGGAVGFVVKFLLASMLLGGVAGVVAFLIALMGGGRGGFGGGGGGGFGGGGFGGGGFGGGGFGGSGGGGGFGGGGGGFSGGGGSFGGGGASGSW